MRKTEVLLKSASKLFALALLLICVTPLIAQDAAPNSIDKDTFTATLSDGLKIQLVGLNEHPLEGQQWWKPDGSALDTPPYEKMEGNPEPQNKKWRHLAIRISGQPEVHDTVDVNLNPSPEGSYMSTPTDAAGKSVPAIDARIAAFPNDAKTVDVTFKIASGPWQTRKATAHGGSSSSGSDEGTMFSVPRANGKGASIVVAFYFKQMPGDKRVVAVDKNDKEHTCSSMMGTSLKDIYIYDATFDLKPTQIKEYRLQTRDYDTEVQFKNVSLDRDNRTDVSIEVGAPTTTP
jgi:hypothetical protein